MSKRKKIIINFNCDDKERERALREAHGWPECNNTFSFVQGAVQDYSAALLFVIAGE